MPDFLLPDLGEGLEEAEVIAWRVKPGDRVGTQWVIDEGLKPGDRIVAEGVQKVGPGATVVPQPAGKN